MEDLENAADHDPACLVSMAEEKAVMPSLSVALVSHDGALPPSLNPLQPRVIGGTEDRSHGHRLAGVLAVLVTAGLLVYASLDMPRLGDPDAPAHNHVAPRYLRQSGEEIGIPNVVTSVLASYRGYDTLGEVTVIFTAGVGVLCLLGGRGRRRREDQRGR